jgi:hypothetical protein
VSKLKDALSSAGVRVLDDQPEGGYTLMVSAGAVDEFIAQQEIRGADAGDDDLRE